MADPFIIEASESEVRKEKEKARVLRKTRWCSSAWPGGSAITAGKNSLPPS